MAIWDSLSLGESLALLLRHLQYPLPPSEYHQGELVGARIWPHAFFYPKSFEKHIKYLLNNSVSCSSHCRWTSLKSHTSQFPGATFCVHVHSGEFESKIWKLETFVLELRMNLNTNIQNLQPLLKQNPYEISHPQTKLLRAKCHSQCTAK